MFFGKRGIMAIALVLTIAILSSFMFGKNNVLTHSNAVVISPVVILDAGHGGFDGGAVANDGTVEKDINLKITVAVAEMLKQSGFKVILTRENDISTDDVETDSIAVRKKSDLKNRLNLMKDYPDGVFVSIHLNKFTTSAASGSQVFYSGEEEKSKLLGDHIQRSIITLLQPENKRVNKQATSSTYLLYNATIPAVLVECGFLSNSQELKLLKTDTYQNQMAFCIFCGILEYFSNLNGV